MPRFDLVCSELVRNRTEYIGLTAETLQEAVYLAAIGEAAADQIEPRGNPPETLIATDNFRFPPLSSAAIDDLCNRLNCQE